MSVLVEAINVIVRKETLEHKYPGGLQAYEKDCPNKSFLRMTASLGSDLCTQPMSESS